MIPIFDLHSDILIDISRTYTRTSHKSGKSLDEWQAIMKCGNVLGRVLSVWIEEVYKPGNTLKRALDLISIAKREIKRLNNAILVLNGKDLEKFGSNEGFYYVISLEGADPIYDDILLLDVFYNLGVRLITLTWSTRNFIADGVFESRTRGGLTRFGLELLERIKELGVIVDLSHISDSGFWDVIENFDGPVMASHSNSRTVHDNLRNLTDEQAKAIAERGGIVGLNVIPNFVGLNKDLESFMKHLEHFVDIIGIDHVAFGFDFVYYIYNDYKGLNGLSTERDLPKLISRLLENYTREEVEKVCWRNAISFIGSNLK